MEHSHNVASGTKIPLLLAILALTLEVAASATAGDENVTTTSPGAAAFWKVLSHYAVTTLHTVEVFVRGFLLGFGATLLKDLLIDGKREAADRANAVHYGKYIGLGMGCVLVGLSVLIPTRLQEWVMQSADVSLKY